MWKLLPIILLASCAATDHNEAVSDKNGTGTYRIVNTLDVPLKLSSKPDTEKAVSKEFSQGETRGRIQQTGAWNISSAVVHTRLRCGTYETGIQLGKGNQACTDVEWLTDIDYGTRRTHCNSAALVHTGGGESAKMADLFETSTCVRVVTRCEGAC
jgi:hypothetical protein